MAASTSTAIEIDATLVTNQHNASPPINLIESQLSKVDKTLASMGSLTKLLPSGTVLAFQALSSSFTNQGQCYVANEVLTGLLLGVCVISCIFFSFTDSFVGKNGKFYYGIATIKGFAVVNYNEEDDEENQVFPDLKRFRVRLLDYVHAAFSVLVFLAVAMSDTEIQSCFFPDAGANARELLKNLPLGAGLFSSSLFVVFPTTRKGIGYASPPQS